MHQLGDISVEDFVMHDAEWFSSKSGDMSAPPTEVPAIDATGAGAGAGAAANAVPPAPTFSGGASEAASVPPLSEGCDGAVEVSERSVAGGAAVASTPSTSEAMLSLSSGAALPDDEASETTGTSVARTATDASTGKRRYSSDPLLSEPSEAASEGRNSSTGGREGVGRHVTSSSDGIGSDGGVGSDRPSPQRGSRCASPTPQLEANGLGPGGGGASESRIDEPFAVRSSSGEPAVGSKRERPSDDVSAGVGASAAGVCEAAESAKLPRVVQ